MKTILLVLLLSLTTCSLFSEWTHLGLSNHFVLDLTIYEEYLYAATDNGIYKKNIDQEDTLWVHLGLEDQYVNCLTVLNHETIITGMSFLNSEHPILRTDNGGISWYPFSEGIDPDDFYFQTLSIDYHPETPHIIFSTGISYVLRLIEPSNIWELVAGDWSMIALGYHFVKIHPEHPNLIWVGGEYGSLNPFLLKSYDGGDNWLEFNLATLVGGDNASESIAFDPVDDQTLYVGMEGRVIKSIDGGYNWTVMMESEFDIWGMAVSKHNNQIVYASSHQRYVYEDLLLYISSDGGETWDVVNGGFGKRMTYSLEYRALEGLDELFLGTIGDGVFRYRNEIDEVSTEEEFIIPSKSLQIANYPNPFNYRTTIRFSLLESANVNLSIYSIKGNRIVTLLDDSLQNGDHSIVWDGADKKGNLLPSGIYFPVLETETEKTIGKMLLLK